MPSLPSKLAPVKLVSEPTEGLSKGVCLYDISALHLVVPLAEHGAYLRWVLLSILNLCGAVGWVYTLSLLPPPVPLLLSLPLRRQMHLILQLWLILLLRLQLGLLLLLQLVTGSVYL